MSKDSSDVDVDRYIQESVKSYKDCNVKNNARRNSLQKKTLGIESEWRMTSAKLSREERHLREQLKQMNIEKAKNHILHTLREPKPKKKVVTKKTEHHIPTEPYPVTFRDHSPDQHTHGHTDKHLEELGKRYAARGRRRQSREFEDLSIDTSSGALFNIHEHDPEGSINSPEPRKRSNTMSAAQRILSRNSKSSTGSQYSNPNSPRNSPLPRSKRLGKGGHNCCSSSESVNGSHEKITSLDDLHWVGEPEAIHSVRRLRRTVEEQELEHEIHRLGISLNF